MHNLIDRVRSQTVDQMMNYLIEFWCCLLLMLIIGLIKNWLVYFFSLLLNSLAYQQLEKEVSLRYMYASEKWKTLN